MRNLPALVRERFQRAQAAGDLTYSPTQLAILHCNSLPFQLRYSPALAHKPKAAKPKDTTLKPFDPFLIPPEPLLIAEVGSYNLVLNKFPVIPDHFILATKEFKKQTCLLEEADLQTAYDCLRSYQAEGEELFGFFNSGDHSGASQPHRHIQFLPVESMRRGLGQESQWFLLADRLAAFPASATPFTYFSASLPVNIPPSDLYATYLILHQRACRLMQVNFPTNLSVQSESPISYNLGFTNRSMVLCPRISEGLLIQDNEGNNIGPVALNGTLLAGTLLVKSEAEWDTLLKDERILTHILKTIGVPRNTIDHNPSGPFHHKP
ncbi:hypothetical protein DSL72_000049 [Monilinia vaccinii-corymbosi]|uniref:HIT domain-containing protein n=1 Tax=Monilinia vaccinii-corymbosi TaxID=61207 RepID=A0A8A3NXU8_9HELO|nr:hypothetical protein DSL72_000049 [Monilinia vaccinii-corymbosi]